ncbi:MAG TPA: hypothetical protein VNS88_05395 [Nitrospiraceae bacterium]|nr:hypothetical protein [Nitrospiraceae bacterium]
MANSCGYWVSWTSAGEDDEPVWVLPMLLLTGQYDAKNQSLQEK